MSGVIVVVMLILAALGGGHTGSDETTSRDIAKIVVLLMIGAGIWYVYGQAMAGAVQP